MQLRGKKNKRNGRKKGRKKSSKEERHTGDERVGVWYSEM